MNPLGVSLVAFSLLYLVMADIDAKWDNFQKCIKAVKPDVRVYLYGEVLYFVYNDPEENSDSQYGDTNFRFRTCTQQTSQSWNAIGYFNIADACEYDEDLMAILHRDDTEEVKRYLWPEEDDNIQKNT